MSSKCDSKFCLKRVNRGASGTLEKPQKSLSSLQRFKKRMSKLSEGMENIFWSMRAERKPVKG